MHKGACGSLVCRRLLERVPLEVTAPHEDERGGHQDGEDDEEPADQEVLQLARAVELEEHEEVGGKVDELCGQVERTAPSDVGRSRWWEW